MKLNPKQLAASAALLGVLACAAALPASAANPVTTPLALTLPKVSFPWDKVTAESIETGSYDAAPLAGTAQQLSPVTTPANAASKNGVTYVSDNPNVVSVDSEGVAQAVGLGTANITATCGGVSCTYTIPAGCQHDRHRNGYHPCIQHHCRGRDHQPFAGSAAHLGGQLYQRQPELFQ